MKDSIEKLSQRKRGELARIVGIIRKKVPQSEMIILFGSYARGDWVEDITVEDQATYEDEAEDVKRTLSRRSVAKKMLYGPAGSMKVEITREPRAPLENYSSGHPEAGL